MKVKSEESNFNFRESFEGFNNTKTFSKKEICLARRFIILDSGKIFI